MNRQTRLHNDYRDGLRRSSSASFRRDEATEPKTRPVLRNTTHRHASTSRRSEKRLQRRASRSRWYFLGVFALVVSGIIVAEVSRYRQARVWDAELFVVEAIEVSGNERISTGEILDALGLSVGETTMEQVVSRKLLAKLRHDFADLKTIRIDRDLPSGRVIVRVTERRPVARIENEGRTIVLDEDGVPLDRPFLPDKALTRESDPGDLDGELRSVQEQIAALPEIVTNPDVPDTNAQPVSGDGLQDALHVILLNESLAATRQASVGRSLRIRSVDARDPHRIVTRFASSAGKKVTALLTSEGAVRQLSALYDVYAHRDGSERTSSLATDSTPIRARSAGDARGKTSRGGSDSGAIAPFSETRKPASDARRVAVEEQYDARFASTIYVTSIGGGQNG